MPSRYLGFKKAKYELTVREPFMHSAVTGTPALLSYPFLVIRLSMCETFVNDSHAQPILRFLEG